MTDELGHLNDERKVAPDAGRGECLRRSGVDDAMQIDSVGHHDDARAFDATGREHVADRVRYRDDGRGPSVFPSSPGVRAQRKINPPRRDERHPCAERGHRRGRHRVRGVRMHDVYVTSHDGTAEAPRRPRIQLAGRPTIDDAQAGIGGADGHRLATPRGNDRDVAAIRHLDGEPQRLPLASTPAALRVQVQHTHRHGAQLPTVAQRPQARSRLLVTLFAAPIA